ncbi:MAG: HAMP domain-containing histidine kinase, partial [Chloroflexi bacterium]|nr:HAMP domain-containing histidine kinase [Chloroflexota bacterium]
RPLRLYVRPVLFDFSSNTVLIVGQSLSIEQRTLFQQVATLGLVSAGGMLLLLGGAWFLAGRALVPIQQAFGRQQTFVADAAHELRTPLTSLRVAVELLQRHLSGVNADDDQLLQDLRAELERLERLTTDLLTLARSDLGELTLAVGEVDLAVLTSDVVRRVQRLAAEHGASVSYNGPPETLWIEGDPDRLQQLLLILLDNAFKHAPGSSVTVRLGAHGHQAQLEVEDNGPGIPSEALQQVFDRFYRADPARPTGGSGLGLAIARSLVTAHGGKIDVGSARGRGTLVTIRLPLQRPEETLGQSGRGAVTYVVPGARALWKRLRRSSGHAPLRSHPPSD